MFSFFPALKFIIFVRLFSFLGRSRALHCSQQYVTQLAFVFNEFSSCLLHCPDKTVGLSPGDVRKGWPGDVICCFISSWNTISGVSKCELPKNHQKWLMVQTIAFINLEENGHLLSFFIAICWQSSKIMQKRGRKLRNITVVMIIFISTTHKRQKLSHFSSGCKVFVTGL